ncbi:RsfA family transcriptional regulator [Fodinisporobacter ferrooxydans]|uniref:RsfA family transcriptional regulator n=1 Tax=Fodinisporobacter ferrooxydans TaxID=2901836 RepID=A0ABY4CSM1_9BACL|nr:RsfA family transcriptional regulator [Alicyclobacillaceae bacterium MYW30-H2]
MQMIERWATRSDSWSSEDDRRLAEIVLRHIREGSTQLKAFVECSDVLSRTPAACGYRWNGVVRKHYETEIKQAKLDRKHRMSNRKDTVVFKQSPPTKAFHSPNYSDRPLSTVKPTVSLSKPLETNRLSDALTCIEAFAASYKDLQAKNILLEESISQFKQRIRELEEEIDRLREMPVTPISQAEQLNEDSKTLLQIMDRARKILDLDVESNEPKVKFRMDRNGNLERIHV